MAHRHSVVTSPVTVTSVVPVAPVGSSTPEELLEQIAAEQAQIAERLATVRAMIARGTGDVTQAAAAARAAAALTPPVVAPPLAERLESALRSGIWSLDELAQRVRAPANTIAAHLKRWRVARQIYNVGSEDQPRWIWIVGDPPDGQPAALYSMIEQLIAFRPFEFAELAAATGARRGKISGAIVDLQKRFGRGAVLNLGTQARARWFLPRRAMVVATGAGGAGGGVVRAAARRAS